MKSRKVKSLALSAACLAIAIAVTACTNDKANTASQTPSPSAGSSDAVASSPAAPSPSASPAGEEDVKQAEGEYTGMIDGHSIEIILDGEATAFQIDMETAEQVSDWEMGTRVKFRYTAKSMDINGDKIQVLTIQTIDKA